MNTNAQKPNLSPKEIAKIEKEAKKTAKKKAKELAKDGWKIEQSTTLEEAIAKHNASIKENGLTEKLGTANGMKTRSICRKKIEVDVPKSYAQSQSIVLKGVLDGKDRNVEEDTSEDFINAFEGKYAMEVAGELVESFSIYRQNYNGTYDMQIFYLVDPEKAHAAKLRAAKYAMELEELDEQWCKKISERVNATKD